MDEELDRRYDTYLIRVWRVSSTDRWLRAEVRHVQSAWSAERRWVDDEVADPLTWVLAQLTSEAISHRASDGGGTVSASPGAEDPGLNQ
jgi:hypothetical protein